MSKGDKVKGDKVKGGKVKGDNVRVRLLFVDDGSYHHEEVELPAGSLEHFDRLIDCVREDPVVLKRVHVDVGRLCAAYLIDD